jgi:protein-tyrosine phosphatase
MEERGDISQILENLFLGSITAAQDLKLMQRYKMTHVIVAGDMSNEEHKDDDYTEFEGVEYLRFRIFDDPSGRTKISKHFEEAFSYLDKCLKDPRNRVLVHCWAGISRSATLVIAYLMHHIGLSLPEAWEWVRVARTWILPNKSFKEQLLEYAEQAGYMFLPHRNKLNMKEWFAEYYTVLRDLLNPAYISGKRISQDDKKRILKIYSQGFGPYHPCTRNITQELKALE